MLTLGAALGLGAASSAVNLGGSFLGSLFNGSQAEKAVERQIQGSKELMDYEQGKYLSPKAQVKNIGAAGLNPAAAFGNTAPVNIGSSAGMPNAQPAMMNVGTQSLSDVASLLVGAAQAKKAGADTGKVIEDTNGVVLDNQRKQFENDMLTRFGLQKSSAELALAEQNVKLAQASTDVALQEKALKQWQSAKEKALSEVNETQRDILIKELNNKDTELKLRNEKASEEIKTEISKQSANYASAENQRTQADVNREIRRLQSALADVEDSGKHAKIDALLREFETKNLISAADAAEARRKLETIGMARGSDAGKIVDSVFEWLKGKVSIFK